MRDVIDIPDWKYRSFCDAVERSQRCSVIFPKPDISEAIAIRGVMMNNDLISMEEAIRAVHDEFDECLNVDESGEYIAFWVEGVLKTLPCVIPERKKGKWIEPSREGHWTDYVAMTNADRIRVMTDEELAEWISKSWTFGTEWEGYASLLDWLKEEADGKGEE